MKFLGVDAGGTKTIAAVSNEKGEIIGTGRGGSGNHLVVGIERMKVSITQAIFETGIEDSFDIAVFGLSGLGFSEESAQKLTRILKGIVRAERVLAFNDCYVAARGALGAVKSGIVVIAGTGSMVIGIDDEGKPHRMGGWGHILGDEGSGYRLSFDAVRAVMRFLEGRGQKTELVDAIASFFKINSISDAIRLFYMERISKDRVASFAEKFLEIALNGDDVANEILEKNLLELVECVKVLGERLKTTYVTYSGSLFNSTFYKEKFRELIESEGFEFHERYLSPVGGALLIALENAGKFNEEVLNNLKRVGSC